MNRSESSDPYQRPDKMEMTERIDKYTPYKVLQSVHSDIGI